VFSSSGDWRRERGLFIIMRASVYLGLLITMIIICYIVSNLLEISHAAAGRWFFADEVEVGY